MCCWFIRKSCRKCAVGLSERAVEPTARCVPPFGEPESNSCGLDGTLLLHDVSCCSVNQRTSVGQMDVSWNLLKM